MSDRLWEVVAPTKVMLEPFDYVAAMVGGTRRRVGVERFKSLFPIRVRMHPEVYFIVAAHPRTTNGIILTEDGLMYVSPDASLKRERVEIDPRYGQ